MLAALNPPFKLVGIKTRLFENESYLKQALLWTFGTSVRKYTGAQLSIWMLYPKKPGCLYRWRMGQWEVILFWLPLWSVEPCSDAWKDLRRPEAGGETTTTASTELGLPVSASKYLSKSENRNFSRLVFIFLFRSIFSTCCSY